MNRNIPEVMHAVHLKGHGGLEQLEYRADIPIPTPGADDVLIRVAAAGVNNTDINTRIGWYSKSVTDNTDAGGVDGFAQTQAEDAGWAGKPLAFPLIQGADCCGRIVDVGTNVDRSRVGERVLVRNMLRGPVEFRPFECWTFGSDCPGGVRPVRCRTLGRYLGRQ